MQHNVLHGKCRYQRSKATGSPAPQVIDIYGIGCKSGDTGGSDVMGAWADDGGQRPENQPGDKCSTLARSLDICTQAEASEQL